MAHNIDEMKNSLRQRLLNYFIRNEGVWIPSGEIQRLVVERTKYTPSNATRRLRELAEEELLAVKQVKGHAWYRYVKGTLTKKVSRVEVRDGVAYEVMETIRI